MRLGRLIAVSLDLAIIVFLAASAVMRADYESFYEGDIGTGTSLAYVARFYRDRGFSLEGSAYGMESNGSVINVTGMVVRSYRYSVLFGGDGESLVVYSDDQKLKEPVPLELDPLYVRVRATRAANKMVVYVGPRRLENLSEIESLGERILGFIRDAGARARIYVNFKLIDEAMLEGIREGRIPVYWLETVLNRFSGGLIRFAGSVDYPLYLSFQDVPLGDVGRATHILESFLGRGQVLAYDLNFKVVMEGEVSMGVKAEILRDIRSMPGVRYVRVSTTFGEEG